MTPSVQLAPLRGTEDPDRFAALLAPGYLGDEQLPRQLLEQTRAFLAASPRPDPWGSFFAWDGDTVVGLCAFKHPPDHTGAVEIAYVTSPAYEGRGYAKAMISALVELAAHSGALTILAHTLPETNASNVALRRQGFRFVDEVIDPDDGPVWRWENTV